MFHDVVIPLDGSEPAAVALPVGIALASTAEARARVVGIAPTDAELAWTYQHVHDDAKRAGLGETDVEVRVDPKPVEVLLDIGNDPGAVLCLASRYDPAPVATLLHSVGSQVIERIQQPVILVGQNAIVETGGSEVVVALDGRNDGGSLLSVAAAWARRLGAALRIVTVYESIPPDVRETMHFTRAFGPQGDPDEYLASMRERVDDVDHIDTVSIPHDFGAGRGLEEHLRDCPAGLLVVGRHRSQCPRKPAGSVTRHLLGTVTCPLLIVDHDDDHEPGDEQ